MVSELLNKAIIFTISVFSLLFIPTSVNAEPLAASIWTPDKVLLNQQYYGIIVIDENLDSDIIFDIITDNDEVVQVLTENVLIPKGKHHAIITLQTKGTGDAKIYAIYKDTLLEQELEVVESAATPTKVDLITPSSLVGILTGNNIRHTGYVFLLNDFDNPVIAKEPTIVTLTSNGDVILSRNSVTIDPGNHYAKFSFETKGEGSITASAPNLEPDESAISVSDPSKIELHLEVAPNPIPTGSSAEIYYWLERDGKPYIPSHDVKVTITIDKSTNLSFDNVIKGAIVLSSSTIDRQATDPDAKKVITRSDIQLQRDSTKELALQKGTHYGRTTVYSSFDGTDDININGLAESIKPQKDEEIIQVTDIFTTDTEKSNSDTPTETEMFAFPDPAYDKVEIMISSRSDNGPVLEQVDEEFTVFVDDKLTIDTSAGKIKANENYGILVANVKDIGTSTIFGQRNEVKGEENDLEIKTKYVKNPDITIVPLPVIFGIEQDLFLISSAHDKIITNPDSTTDGNLISITSRPAFDYTVINDKTSVITIKGMITNLLEEDPVVHVASNAFTATETLEVYNPNRNKIDSMHPTKVYAGEPFPIVNHISDLDDNPMRKAELRVSSGAEMGTTDSLVYFNQSGTHGIIFYDKNTVPVESKITVAGLITEQISEVESQQVIEEKPPSFTYTINVVNGEGSGIYPEGATVTISAPVTIDDMFIIKKKLVGWENLPYQEATATFEADFDVETKPIYQNDLTMLFLASGGGVGVGSVVMLNKKRKKTKKDDDSMSEEERMIDELLEK